MTGKNAQLNRVARVLLARSGDQIRRKFSSDKFPECLAQIVYFF